MKKQFLFIVSLIILLNSIFVTRIFAETNISSDIRIGLINKYNKVDSVPIKNKSIEIGYAENNIFVPINVIYATSDLTIKAINDSEIGIYEGENIVYTYTNTTLNMQIKPLDNEYIQLGNNSYRGLIEFARYPNNKLIPINILDIEEYLYSVVPSEMPALWHEEALKAQAVAARTYTLFAKNNSKYVGFDLNDTIISQVYNGVTSEHERTTQAVKATKGIIAIYNNEPIESVFFSSSGGKTENSENVWANAVPYLKSVDELNEVEAKKWTRSVSLAEINSMLLSKNISIGYPTGINITKLTPANRVEEVTITGTNGAKVLKKEEIRTFFSTPKDGVLESRNFKISVNTNSVVPKPTFEVSSAQAEGYVLKDFSNNNKSVSVQGNILFDGVGYGHGVGMSQFGAKGMAEAGYTFDKILKHYYTGIELN